MFSGITGRVFLAASFSLLSVAQIAKEPPANMDAVRQLIDKAALSGDPVEWAKYLMQADKAAEALEQSTPGGCGGNRCVRIKAFLLNYRFFELDGKEYYQHDLLQTIVRVHGGTPDGAEALALLLPTGCQTISTAWTPYFRTALEILELQQWKQVSDFRLTKMRAEAYETWWSLSKMGKGDALVTDFRINPADFVEGSSLARERYRGVSGAREIQQGRRRNCA